MARVRLLEKSVAERIAAGEVVERPASVVKELVENALDAGADRILVELQNGGTTMLRVTDNGCGMSRDDALLALERFATSKIVQWEDMDRLTSLGFRGEALPSIAAVSKMEILTCEHGCNVGTEVVVEGGNLISERPAPAVAGTRITVSDLFFNTPARRKFLKSAAGETSQVLDLLTRMALIRQDVLFHVRSNGRDAMLVTPQMNIKERVATLWKVPVDALVPFEGEVGGVAAQGLVALPQHARPTRTHQLFSINARVIRSATLSQAVLEGFQPLLGRGRYPVAVVHLSLDPALVDVNVHPTKAEVRFADGKSPFRAIYRSIAAALERHGADSVQDAHWELAGVADGSTAGSAPASGPAAGGAPASGPPSGFEENSSSTQEWGQASGQGAMPQEPEQFTLTATPRPANGQASNNSTKPAWHPPAKLAWQPPPPTRETLELFRPTQQETDVRVLSQLYKTFIVCEVDGELWVVDQHTAHERIWYERLGRLSPLNGISQGLLIPEVIEFTKPVAAFLEGYLEPLQELGFEVEPFGGEAFQLRGVPTGLKPTRGLQVLRSVVEDAAAENISEKHHAKEHQREKLRAMVSCKSAVKAGDALTFGEMESLVREMLTVEHSLYCPHGRPTRVKLDSRALERLFHR